MKFVICLRKKEMGQIPESKSNKLKNTLTAALVLSLENLDCKILLEVAASLVQTSYLLVAIIYLIGKQKKKQLSYNSPLQLIDRRGDLSRLRKLIFLKSTRALNKNKEKYCLILLC